MRLLHHSGSTLLSLHGSIFRVRDGRLTALGDSSGDVRMSHDGRYAAWLTNVANSNCGGLGLEVYEVSTASQVAVTPIDGEHCGHVQGIDDLGRVYVSIVRDDQPAAADVRMYDIRQRRWSHVSGLPQTPAVSHYSTSYVTADGFAVAADEHAVTTPTHGDVIVLSSIEGRVDNDGRFVQPRPVPIGHGLWSPDRSLVVDQRLDGVVVRPANDLRVQRPLQLPADRFHVTATRIPLLNLQWESANEVLVTWLDPAPDETAYRCDVHSGACTIIDRTGVPALGNSTPQPG